MSLVFSINHCCRSGPSRSVLLSWISLSYLIALSEFNLPIISSFTWLTPPGPYRATTCREKKLISGSHTFFLTTQGLGEPPRMRDQLNAGANSETAQTWRRYIPGTHSVIPTRRIWNDVYSGQMKFGDLCGPKVSWHLSYRRGKKPEKTEKTSLRKPIPTGDRTRARCVTGACYHLIHSGGLSLLKCLR